MSGIEIAGLVLGAFPIAIEGIKAYSSGMKTISDIRNYKQILRQFARELSVEKCKFENTCLGLLSELVNSAKLELMMANPGGKEWNDEFFRLQLKNRLGPANEASENWLEIVAELNQMLRMVGERFQIPQDNGKKVQPSLYVL